jgi:cation:H+ antiporter
MLTNIFLVLLGFLLLIRGADYFVAGSASLAKKMGVPTLIVGLTIISIGTSAPELFVNVIAATQGATDLSIGNVLGSNFADILLGLGIAAVIVPLSLKSATVWKEIPFSLLGAFMILVFGSDYLLDGTLPNAITRVEGIALFSFFIIFLVYTMGVKKSGEQPQEHIQLLPSWKMFGSIFGGIAALAIGGYLTVEAAVGIAAAVGMSQNLIGLTVVAAGTSLPEIVTAVQAARKNHIDLVVGGIIGTIIFNSLFVLGTTAIISPLPFNNNIIVDAIAVMVITVTLFIILLRSGKKKEIGMKTGVLFVVIYLAYITFAVIRG